LKQRAAKAGVTSAVVLLSAFAEILTLWSKNPKFTINLALFNRLPLHPQVNDLLGDFTTVNLLAVDNSASTSFIDRSRRIQSQLWQDLEHRYFSGVRVTRELATREGRLPSAIPIVFTSTLGFGTLGQATSTFSDFGELIYGISQASQVWIDVQVWEDKDALTFNWDVVEELFPAGMLQDMFEAYCRFLKQLVTSDLAWVETHRQLLSPTRLEQQVAVNANPVADEMLHTLFLDRVATRTHQPAVITPQQILTYKQLCDRAHQVGRRLRELGAVPNRLVAVVMEKGWEQVVAVLGILISGAAYLPIDPESPQQRRSHLLTQGEVICILTQSHLERNLQWTDSIPRSCIDTDELLDLDNSPLQSVQQPEDLAYVIYTSGSTGLPKGVAIDHRGAVNTIADINRRFGVKPDDKVLALSSLSFDLSVFDIFGTLAAGGAIVIPDVTALKDPAHWLELMHQQQVTLWNSIPTLMQMLVEYAAGVRAVLPNSLRLVLLSGDWIPLNLPQQIQATAKNARIIGLGGATEASIWSIYYPIEQVDPNWKSIPYGKPLTNQQFYVLNELLEPCPTWVTGQLYIGGIGLAKGYWQDEEKTNFSFISHPRTKERLYKTGDLGRYLPDGNIEFLGRADFQVKIRGYRIELGEIEATLLKHHNVQAAVVKAVGEPRDRLIAYIVPTPEHKNLSEQLQSFLREKLPAYMIPNAFVMLDALPLSANGKVDRKALPEPERLSAPTAVKPSSNAIAQQIAEIVADVLKIEQVDLAANLLNLGATSVELVQIANQLEQKLQHRLKINELVYISSLNDIAIYYEKQNKVSDREKSNNNLTVDREDWEEGEI